MSDRRQDETAFVAHGAGWQHVGSACQESETGHDGV